MNRLASELLSHLGSLRIEALHQRALESRTRTTSSTRFPHRNTSSTRKPDSLWREKRNTVDILVRRLIVRVINFLSIFAKNGKSNLVLVLVLVLQSKGP